MKKSIEFHPTHRKFHNCHHALGQIELPYSVNVLEYLLSSMLRNLRSLCLIWIILSLGFGDPISGTYFTTVVPQITTFLSASWLPRCAYIMDNH